MNEDLRDTSPLGRSVEEVERDGGNLQNSSTPGESVRRGEDDLPPVPLLSGPSSAVFAQRGTTGPLLHREEGADTGRPDSGRGDDSTDDAT